MEKPGLEPPPPAFPNKGLIEAGPAQSPGPLVPRGGRRAVAMVSAQGRMAAASESPQVSPPAAGWGSLSPGGVVGSAGG